MNIKVTKHFEKRFKKLPPGIKQSFKTRVSVFILDPFNIKLNNHKLHGSLNKYRSININGDYRLIFEEVERDTILLIDVNTHSELYK